MPFIVPDYLDGDKCKEVSNWAKNWYAKIGSKPLHKSGAPSISASVPIKPSGNIQRWVDLSQHECGFLPSLREKLLSDFGIKIDNAMLNYYAPKTKVGVHSHELEKGKVDLRFNIIVQQPELGGNPIIDGRTYCIKQGDLLVFDSRKPHETDVIGGNTDRILVSCIAVISESELAKRFFFA